MSDLFSETKAAFERVQEKQLVVEATAAANTATKQDAAKSRDAAVAYAKAAYDEAVGDAVKVYELAVKDASAAHVAALGELQAAQAELDGFRSQLNAVLGTDKSSRATVVGG